MSTFVIQLALGLLLSLGGATYMLVATHHKYFILTFLYAIALILIVLAIAKVFKSNYL